MNDSIVIGFSRPKLSFLPPPLFAWAIMLFQRTNYAHAYIRFHLDAYDRDVVFQASGTKVNFIEWANFQSIEVIVKEFEIPVSDTTEQSIIQYAISEVGAPYALGMALGIVVVKAAALFGKKIKNPISQRGTFCSDLAAIVLKDYIGADLTEAEARCMDPKDLYNYLVANKIGLSS